MQLEIPGHPVEWHRTIGSTMTRAAELANAGCASGTVVWADEQTAGQGRYGRVWHSEPGAGLYVSLVLRLPFPPETLPLVTLALGVAVAGAILQTSGLACDLRWPNDVLIRGKKCAGILTQLEGNAIIAGIGINVNHAAFPPELQPLATSLYLASGKQHSREQLLQHLLPSIDQHCGILLEEGREPILRMFSQSSSYVGGRRVAVELGSSVLHGVTAGLNDSGFLLLRSDDGRQHVILAGGVRPA